MGIPAGKPKTIAVDLTGKFLSASREVRIVTNLCVYWDEIFLGEESAPPREDAAPRPLQEGTQRILPHQRVDGHRVGAEPVEEGARIGLGGAADVAA